MNFFSKHKESTNRKKHFEFLINLCLLTIDNEYVAKQFILELKNNGNFKYGFKDNFDPRITFWIEQFALKHKATDVEVYGFPSEQIPSGPDYSDWKELYTFILEAFFIILILDDITDISKQLQNLNSYSKQKGFTTSSINNILQNFQDLIKTNDCYFTDIRQLDFYETISIVFSRIQR